MERREGIRKEVSMDHAEAAPLPDGSEKTVGYQEIREVLETSNLVEEFPPDLFEVE